MKDADYVQIKEKIKNLQNAIIQRAIIKDAYILNDAKNYLDLIYNYSFQTGSEEEVKEWFKIKDVIVLSNLHYIRNSKEEYLTKNNSNNIDYKKILNILNEYQKYMQRNGIEYCISYFDFENEFKIKEELQRNRENDNREKEQESHIYYNSSYSPNGKVLKIEKSYNDVTADEISLFAVIHNLLIRTKIIPKTDYLSQTNLNDQELNDVYYFQMIILNAIKSGVFILNHKNKIAINKTNIEYIKIACNNINYYISLFNHLTKAKTEEIKYTIMENNEPGIKINEENINYEIIDEGINSVQQIWTNKRIEYTFSQENRLHYEKLLYEIFKFKEFRKGQLEIISNIVQSTNQQLNVGILPTGYGKSLIYQFMAILQPLKTIIISPTEILLYDQIVNLHENDFDLVSVLNQDRITDASIINYSTTETFLHERMLKYLEMLDNKKEIFNIVLDECHYISIWGHSFNPSYLALSKAIVENIKNAQITMVTATASNVCIKRYKITI